jgi:hypothetical protein
VYQKPRDWTASGGILIMAGLAVMNNIGMTLDKPGGKRETIAWCQKAKDHQGGKKK